MNQASKDMDVYVCALSSVRGIGPARLLQLLSAYPDPERFERATVDELAAVLGQALAGQLQRLRDSGAWSRRLAEAEEKLRRCLVKGVTPVTLASERYSRLLRLIPDPPPVLYARGNLGLLERVDAVAVVGTRKPTDLGLRIARRVAQHFASRGYVVVSGLAMGIDTAAHQGALEAQGATVAVLGTPVDKIYPAENQPLARRILERGGLLLSEHPPGASTDRRAFVRRDRIQSGLSLAVFPIQTDVISERNVGPHRLACMYNGNPERTPLLVPLLPHDRGAQRVPCSGPADFAGPMYLRAPV